jgi:hypothetical protein
MPLLCGAGGSRWGLRVDENESTRFILENRIADTFSGPEGVLKKREKGEKNKKKRKRKGGAAGRPTGLTGPHVGSPSRNQPGL